MNRFKSGFNWFLEKFFYFIIIIIPIAITIVVILAITFVSVFVLGLIVRNIIEFFSISPAPKSILQTFFYIMLLLGITGVFRGIVDLFILGTNFDSSHYQDEIRYKENVRQASDCLFFVGGALLFLVLL